ncbi:hypothetical protein DQG23_38250 [Paenibacillus contaminans]|uniref:Uncharacterized protein n=1 Tax=Paenibacillus contaminans TaxID=450362 RepID=A0A329LT40_9BACL|nr:hypothetical protein DQG23_38250 [Paenibacillus contaminans]
MLLFLFLFFGRLILLLPFSFFFFFFFFFFFPFFLALFFFFAFFFSAFGFHVLFLRLHFVLRHFLKQLHHLSAEQRAFHRFFHDGHDLLPVLRTFHNGKQHLLEIRRVHQIEHRFLVFRILHQVLVKILVAFLNRFGKISGELRIGHRFFDQFAVAGIGQHVFDRRLNLNTFAGGKQLSCFVFVFFAGFLNRLLSVFRFKYVQNH